MGYIKIVEKITDEKKFKKLLKGWENQTKLDLDVEDLGFCIKHKLSKKDQERWDEIQKWKEENIWSKKKAMSFEEFKEIVESGEMPPVVDESPKMPDDMEADEEALSDKIYKDFHFAAPGYFKETMKIAKKNSRELPTPIPKGARIYYDYPLSCIVVGEITEDLTTSDQFIEAFCEGYIEIYKLEEESSKKEAMSLKDENPNCHLINRNRTDGCFGIWGHHIGDLVLEGVNFYSGGKHITLSIGS